MRVFMVRCPVRAASAAAEFLSGMPAPVQAAFEAAAGGRVQIIVFEDPLC